MEWEKKWNTPQEYIKYKRSLMGRYDFYPGLIDVNLDPVGS